MVWHTRIRLKNNVIRSATNFPRHLCAQNKISFSDLYALRAFRFVFRAQHRRNHHRIKKRLGCRLQTQCGWINGKHSLTNENWNDYFSCARHNRILLLLLVLLLLGCRPGRANKNNNMYYAPRTTFDYNNMRWFVMRQWLATTRTEQTFPLPLATVISRARGEECFRLRIKQKQK